MMKGFFVTTGRMRPAAWAFVVGVSLLFGADTPAFAQDARAIEGVWAISVQLRDCTTNTPTGAPPERSLLTFHQGGTLSASAGGTAFAPGQRSPAHGVWTHAGGSTFRNRQAAIVLFDTPPNLPASPGFQTGWLVITSTYTMSGANALTVSATSEFFNTARTPYRTACVGGTGERFQ